MEDLPMKLYQASLYLSVLKRYYELFPDEPLNVLISLAYNQSERKGFLVDYRHMSASIIGDSGAWSVAEGTSELKIESVIAQLQECGHQLDRYFSFDTDFTDRGFDNNIVNQFQMERAGLKPIPVVHNFYDGEIDYYVKSGKYDWLALGSTQAKDFESLKYAVDRIKTWGNPEIKIHWFGGSRFEWLCQLPIASCDTTSWAATGKFGEIMYWNPLNPQFDKADTIYVGGRIKKIKESEHHINTYCSRKELKAYLCDTFKFTNIDLWGYDEKFHMQLVNTRYFAELERRINEERIKRGVPLE